MRILLLIYAMTVGRRFETALRRSHHTFRMLHRHKNAPPCGSWNWLNQYTTAHSHYINSSIMASISSETSMFRRHSLLDIPIELQIMIIDRLLQDSPYENITNLRLVSKTVLALLVEAVRLRLAKLDRMIESGVIGPASDPTIYPASTCEHRISPDAEEQLLRCIRVRIMVLKLLRRHSDTYPPQPLADITSHVAAETALERAPNQVARDNSVQVFLLRGSHTALRTLRAARCPNTSPADKAMALFKCDWIEYHELATIAYFLGPRDGGEAPHGFPRSERIRKRQRPRDFG